MKKTEAALIIEMAEAIKELGFGNHKMAARSKKIEEGLEESIYGYRLWKLLFGGRKTTPPDRLRANRMAAFAEYKKLTPKMRTMLPVGVAKECETIAVKEQVRIQQAEEARERERQEMAAAKQRAQALLEELDLRHGARMSEHELIKEQEDKRIADLQEVITDG